MQSRKPCLLQIAAQSRSEGSSALLHRSNQGVLPHLCTGSLHNAAAYGAQLMLQVWHTVALLLQLPHYALLGDHQLHNPQCLMHRMSLTDVLSLGSIA